MNTRPLPAGATSVLVPEMQRGAVQVRPGTFNEDQRTVDIIWAAGALVKRYSWDEGYYMEELSMDPAHIRMDRFTTGMSLLDSHDSYSMASRLGTVVPGSAKVSGGKGVATVKLSRNELGEALLSDLRDGHPFQVSVGYRTHAYEKREGDQNQLPVLRAVDWEPYELSAVPIPADAGAHSRSDQPAATVRIRIQKGDNMDDELDTRAAVAIEAGGGATIERERERASTILGLAQRAGIGEAEAQQAINDGTEIAKFRARAFDVMVTRQEQTATFPHHDATGEIPGRRGNARDETVQALREVLMGRSTASAIDVGRQHLARCGARLNGMSDREIRHELFGNSRSFMNTTSDFVLLGAAAAQGVLLERFSASPTALKALSRRRMAPNFFPQTGYRLGEAPGLLKLNEHGEIKSGTLSEEKNLFSIETYARIFALSFQAHVNDALGAFADFLANFAESAIALEGDLFYNMLAENNFEGPVLSDGVRLFNGSHGNLMTASALSAPAVAAGIAMMRAQKNFAGKSPAGTAPAYLVVGPSLEFLARQLTATVAAATSSDVNFAGQLKVIVEDRLVDFYGWYLAADPVRRAPFIHGGLEEAGDAPQVDSRDGWNVLGTEYRVIHHFGCGINDFRALVYNPGLRPS